MPEIVVGVLLVAGCALAALIMQRSDSATQTVVIAARPIPRGSVISAQDLAAGNMSGDTSALIVGDDAKSLLGQIATVDIGVGAPLTTSLVSAAKGLGPDEAISSVSLAPGRLPPDLAAGDTVRIVVVGPSATGATSEARLLDMAAEVYAVTNADDPNGNVIVTLRGPVSLTSELAAASTVQLARIQGK